MADVYFKDIAVEVDPPQWNGYRMLIHQCQAEDRVPLLNKLGNARVRCGGDSSYLVTRTSTLSDARITTHMCARHAQPWLDAIKASEVSPSTSTD